ncbi:hypothetical protein N1851_028316 [Merluccius polli]|uniref:Uncharacterized protein n=1 Tax=Merluccius polli TaxID=89951 RepID=A0AA47M912_MERPO|nr:hypothetical protein N1851_028316 [Merluccius polli]
MSTKTLTNFYGCTIDSILFGRITAWYGICSDADCKALLRVVQTAECIIGCQFPSVQGIYHTRCLRKAQKITKDYSYPDYGLFTLLRPTAPAKDKRRDNPKQQIRQPSGEKLLPPEIRIDHEGQHTEREALTSSSLPQHEESPPAPTAQQVESPPAPTTQQEESPPAPTTQHEESPSAPTAQQVESPPAPPGDSQLSPTGTPSSLSFSPRILDSPFPHFLDFTDSMNYLFNVGIQLTPRPNPIFFSPKSPSLSSPSHSTTLEYTITQTSQSPPTSSDSDNL